MARANMRIRRRRQKPTDIHHHVGDTHDDDREPAAGRSDRAAVSRANARQSTGPRTAAGKARSSRNALKHGLFSQQTVIPGEDPADFDALQRRLTRALQPMTDNEERLVERIAVTDWRRQRCENALAAIFAWMLADADTHPLPDADEFAQLPVSRAAAWAAEYGYEKALAVVEKLCKYEERAHNAARAELRRVQREREQQHRLAAEAEAARRKLDGTDGGLGVRQLGRLLLAECRDESLRDRGYEPLASFSPRAGRAAGHGLTASYDAAITSGTRPATPIASGSGVA